jgi:hypothetical protein
VRLRLPEGFPLHGRRGRDGQPCGDVDRVLDNVWRNLERLVCAMSMIEVEDLSEHMQHHVVGVPQAWVGLFRRLSY